MVALPETSFTTAGASNFRSDDTGRMTTEPKLVSAGMLNEAAVAELVE